MKESAKVILFDLGGVLVELGEHPFPSEWFSNKEEAYDLAQWFKSQIALDFERGNTSATQFASAIKEDLKLSASLPEIIQEFTKWPIGLYPKAHEILSTLGEQHTLAVLSNTNELHWPRIIEEFKIDQYSQHIFASHLLRVAKPEKEAFLVVLENMDVQAKSLIFFDDNASNVAAADALGVASYLVKGIDELEDKLIELQLLA